MSFKRVSASRGRPADNNSSAYWSCTSTSSCRAASSAAIARLVVGAARHEQRARIEQLRLDPVRVRLAGRFRVRQRELEIARAQREPRERVLPRGDVRERLVQRRA